MIVKQEIQRYEKGEIAHIENVLKGEEKERIHERSSIVTQDVTTETETTTESEHELETSERFELRSEAKNIINTELSTDAGVEVTHHGPSTSVEAHANFAYTEGVEKSNSNSYEYAREVIDRTLNRISEKVLKDVLQ